MPERHEEKHSKEATNHYKEVKKYKRHEAHGGAWESCVC
jgi:hypothetical protein